MIIKMSYIVMANSPIRKPTPPLILRYHNPRLVILSHAPTPSPPNIEQPHYIPPHSSDNHPNTYTQQRFQFLCSLQSPTH